MGDAIAKKGAGKKDGSVVHIITSNVWRVMSIVGLIDIGLVGKSLDGLM